ncbi:MAG: twin-arginine translocase TatA/TatE family subunit [Planctomycetota bacterium]
MLGFFNNIGAQELVIIFGILLLLFGATKLPQLARSMGKSVKEFKKGMHEHEDEEVSKETEEKKEEDKKRV